MGLRADKVSSLGSCGDFSFTAIARRAALGCTALFLGIFLSPSAAAQVSFERDIEPLFHQRCYMCHGASVQMNGLRLDRKEVSARARARFSADRMVDDYLRVYEAVT